MFAAVAAADCCHSASSQRVAPIPPASPAARHQQLWSCQPPLASRPCPDADEVSLRHPEPGQQQGDDSKSRSPASTSSSPRPAPRCWSISTAFPSPDLGAVYGANTVIGSGPLSVTSTSEAGRVRLRQLPAAPAPPLAQIDGVSQGPAHHRQHHRQRRWRDHPCSVACFGLRLLPDRPGVGTVDIDYTLSATPSSSSTSTEPTSSAAFENHPAGLDNAYRRSVRPVRCQPPTASSAAASSPTVITAVPEYLMALIGLGLAGLAAVRRRKTA